MKTIEIKGKNYFGSYREIRKACRAVIIKNDMVLLSFQKNLDTYMLPGGGLEKNETEKECAIREVEEETSYIVETGECILVIEEYYEDLKYVTKYFVGKILKEGKQRLTPNELLEGMEPFWMRLDDAINMFSKHEAYRDSDEMKRGLYFREFIALTHIKM